LISREVNVWYIFKCLEVMVPGVSMNDWTASL
jgi:hypothetical protein